MAAGKLVPLPPVLLDDHVERDIKGHRAVHQIQERRVTHLAALEPLVGGNRYPDGLSELVLPDAALTAEVLKLCPRRWILVRALRPSAHRATLAH